MMKLPPSTFTKPPRRRSAFRVLTFLKNNNAKTAWVSSCSTTLQKLSRRERNISQINVKTPAPMAISMILLVGWLLYVSRPATENPIVPTRQKIPKVNLSRNFSSFISTKIELFKYNCIKKQKQKWCFKNNWINEIRLNIFKKKISWA